MTLRQSHFVTPVPLVVASELEFLDGVDLVATRTPSSAQQLSALLAGDLDLVVTAIDNLFEWTRAGASLALVAQVEKTTSLRLYARPGLDSLAELQGRRFAVDAYANGFALVARRLLRAEGIDVDYVEVGGVRERLEALLSGEADATLLGPPLDYLAEQAGMTSLLDVNEALPDYPGQGLIVRSDLIGAPELVDYLAVLLRAVAASNAMPEVAGVALLQERGYGTAAAAAWSTRPLSLDVPSVGLELLTSIRADLELLPPGGVGLNALHDPEPLRSAATQLHGL